MVKKIEILGIILLLFSICVFSQEAVGQKNVDQILLKNVEDYLNRICGLDRIFLNIIVKKISRSGNTYIHLDKDVPVRLLLNKEVGIYIDYTFIENPTIYITSGHFLIFENEAELAASIAHELGHLSSSADKIFLDITAEEYLKSEMAADRVAIFVLKEMGYKLEALSEMYERILVKYSGKIHWIQPKIFFVYRFLAVRKLAREIYNSESQSYKKYKDYLYLLEIEFKAKKEIVKYLQEKYEKSGK